MDKTKANSANPNTDLLYDFIFIGLGASNSLLLLSLLERGSLVDKKVAILETESKKINDKTYCFWASPNDLIVKNLAPIISHYYDTIEINQSKQQNIENQPYYYIRSIDLYDYTLLASVKAKIPIIREAVENVSSQKAINTIKTVGSSYQTRYIFDSRPPSLSLLKSNDIYLHQSFYGLHIKCEKDVFQEHTFEMMNFNVEQGDFTQFVYTLPFNARESLVELTRFGAEKIDLNYAKELLDQSIKKDFGNYEIIADETGCIPMTTFINKHNSVEGILNTGASANLIKPSTGYGFKNMYAFAQKVADNIEKGNLRHFNKIALKSKKRFRLYDTLLLTILLYWPEQGKRIFSRLFKSQKILTVFSFLDEKTSLWEELKIFAFLPFTPFIKALFLQFKNWISLRFVFPVISVVAYFIFSLFDKNIAHYFSYLMIILGLLTIGIPHGAVDHMLQAGKKNSLFQFVIKYLSIIVFYFIFWQIFPLLSLVFFISYSAFHFGESELEELGIQINSIAAYLKAFIMGLAILMFIICTHFVEAMEVIAKISGLAFAPTLLSDAGIYSLVVAGLAILYIAYQLYVSHKTFNFALVLLLLLGSMVPLFFAFALYFICHHSYNAWGHIRHGLALNSVALYKKALPYTLGALLIFMLIVFSGSIGLPIQQVLMRDFYIFLACISLPHFLIMHLFYKKKTQDLVR
jgi:lycopene beta-cyclase